MLKYLSLLVMLTCTLGCHLLRRHSVRRQPREPVSSERYGTTNRPLQEEHSGYFLSDQAHNRLEQGRSYMVQGIASHYVEQYCILKDYNGNVMCAYLDERGDHFSQGQRVNFNGVYQGKVAMQNAFGVTTYVPWVVHEKSALLRADPASGLGG